MLHDLAALLLHYQLPIASGLATILVYLANKVDLFRALGDWTKRTATAVAAGLVLLAVRALGGEPTAGLTHLLVTFVGGGTIAATPVAVAYRLARKTPASPDPAVAVSAAGDQSTLQARATGIGPLAIVLGVLLLVLFPARAFAQQVDPCPEVALIATGGRSFAVWLKDTTARPVDSVVVSTRGEWDKALEDVVKWRRARDKHRYDVFALPTFRTRGECRGVTVPPDSTVAVPDSSIATPPDSTPPIEEPAPDSTVVVEPPADTTPVPPPPPPPPPPTQTAFRFVSAQQLANWAALKASNDVRWQAAQAWCAKTGTAQEGYGDSGLWCALVATVDQDATAAGKAIAKLKQITVGTSPDNIREAFLARVLMRDLLSPWLSGGDYAVIDPVLQAWANGAASVSTTDSDLTTGQGCGAILWDIATGQTVDRSGTLAAIARYVRLAHGGSWIESAEYNPGTVNLLAMCELGYRTATGQEIAPGAEQFLRDAGRWAVFEVTPDFRSAVAFSDEQEPRNVTAYRRLIRMAALPSPASQWAWNELVARYWPGRFATNLIARSMLLAHPEVSPQPVGDGTQLADGLGLALRRDAGDLGFLAALNRTGVHHTMSVPFADVQVYRNGEWALTHPAGYNGPWETMVNGPVYAGLSLFPNSGFVRADSGAGWLALTGQAAGGYYAGGYYNPPPAFLSGAVRQVVDATVGGCHVVVVRDSVAMVDPRTLASFDRYRAADQAKIADAGGMFWALWHAPIQPTVSGNTATWRTAGGQQVTITAWSDQPVQWATYDETQLWSSYTYQIQGKAWQLRVRSDAPLYQVVTICDSGSLASSRTGNGVTVAGRTWTFGAGVTGN